MSLRFFSSLLLFVIGTGACARSAARDLEGQWEGVSVENVELAQLAQVTGWARGLSFDFGGSVVTIGMATELPRSGSYRVVRENGRELTLDIIAPDGKVDRAQFVLDSREQLRFRIGEGRSILLRRRVAKDQS